MNAGRLRYEFATSGGLPVLRWPELDATGVVDALVTTRAGGVSEGVYGTLNLGLHVGDDPDRVIRNREIAAAGVGLGLDDMVYCRQSHSATVAVVGPGDRGRGSRSEATAIVDTDALVTAHSGVGLAIMVADCVPIVLVDPVSAVLACVHSGWRGATGRIVSKAVDTMALLGASRQRVIACLGPAIASDRYQVGEDVFDAASQAFGDQVDSVMRPDGTGRWYFDGWEANRRVLADSGVAPANIVVADVGTGNREFFSDRAARPCGRFAVHAVLRVP